MIQPMEKEAVMTQAVPELPVQDFQTVEFYVGNAKQAAYFYNKLFGFDIVAYRGPETGFPEAASYVLKQNSIQFVLTTGLSPDHPASMHAQRHGDGIKDLSFKSNNVKAAYTQAVERGATSVMIPTLFKDEFGVVEKATIATYGETTHTFVDRSQYNGIFEPGFTERKVLAEPVGLQRVDHAVGNVEKGKMDEWVRFYESVFGFYVLRHYDENDISTQYSALVSKVMANQSGTIKLPINEPAEGLKKSQIQEYLDFYKSAGVQHMAISTKDILSTVKTLRQRGVELMSVPDNYYTELQERVGNIQEPIEMLKELGILVDRDDEGYLLQIFTQPMEDRPTFFFEIIQRQGSEGFGKGNFKALFEAIERDQAKRGNL
jgi:4-hydroxyphenylpyruvate dioxygenase